jgi:hypothetical protein
MLLDTIKTRLQSQHGFMASGGFRGIYSGLLTAVIGSAPGGNRIRTFSKNSKNKFFLTLSK